MVSPQLFVACARCLVVAYRSGVLSGCSAERQALQKIMCDVLRELRTGMVRMFPGVVAFDWCRACCYDKGADIAGGVEVQSNKIVSGASSKRSCLRKGCS